MKTIERPEINAKERNKDLAKVISQYKVIDELILDGKDINPELNKNFVTFNLPHNPIKK